MSKYEFILRFSMIKGSKREKFKQIFTRYPQGLPDSVAVTDCLKLFNMNDEQKNQFYQQSNEINYTLRWLEDDNNHLITYFDLSYPQLLKQIHSPPFLLFAKGNIQLLSSPQIAMVGSREFSEYGAQWGRYFAGELAINGFTITSGLALGIDAICHRGALEVSGKTIAVLGGGLADISPKSNLHLFNDIVNHQGVIVSEFLPYEQARPSFFPRRNRIISGLSLGTFVIEANEKSGSLITASYAIEQNRDVFALPGEINNDNCGGTHWLIKQGAYLVTKPTDILEHFVGYLDNNNKTTTDNSQDEKQMIHPEVFSIIHNKPIPVDIIAEQTQQSVTEITIKLLDLELAGAIKTVSGGYIRCINP